MTGEADKSIEEARTEKGYFQLSASHVMNMKYSSSSSLAAVIVVLRAVVSARTTMAIRAGKKHEVQAHFWASFTPRRQAQLAGELHRACKKRVKCAYRRKLAGIPRELPTSY